MNSVVEAILQRRSVRSFSEKDISDEDLYLIAKCGSYAPSALNRQKWHFIIVHNRESIGRLAKAIGEKLGQGGYNFYEPNALIIVTAARDYPFAKQDCSCALENIFLAAHSMGIGSVWINQLSEICDDKKIREVLDAIGVPKEDTAVGIAALGYPKGEIRKADKKSNTIIIGK